jgi:hypothetical protein
MNSTSPTIPSDQLEAMKAEFGDQVRITPSQRRIFLQHHQGAIRTSERQALAIGIDRKVAGQDIEGGLRANCGLYADQDPRVPSHRCRNATWRRSVGKGRRCWPGPARSDNP